jgi:hypothetical protein
MNAHPRVRGNALVGAAGMGVLGDVLMRGSGEPGLNIALWSGAGVVAVVLLTWRRGWPASRESLALLVMAQLFISMFAWRDAEALRALNLFAAAGAGFLAAGEAGAAWIRRAGAGDYMKASALTVLSIASGPILLATGPGAPALQPTHARVAWRTGWATVRGAALAVPPLLVFGGLLASADPVFARVVTETLRLDMDVIGPHMIMFGFFTWISAGYFYGFLLRTPMESVRIPVRQPRIGVLDASVALGLVNALFLTFVIVQLRYLFGGADLVEVTPGLSYAEYARRGFFEMVVVAALVVPLLLLADWGVHRETPRDERVFRLSAVVTVALLFAIMLSALHRMRLYQQAYGLTELRLYTTVFMTWVAVVLAWLVFTVLRGRRQHFAFGALVTAFAAVISLNVMNPHALIVRVNAERASAGFGYDATYPAQLSADAVPALVDVLPALSDTDRCNVVSTLAETWARERPGGWRTWNWGDWRARGAIDAKLSALQSGCASVTT